MANASNVTPIRDAARIQRQARGAYVKNLITADGRSARYVAINIGLNPTSMGERLSGKTAFLADELEEIARVLKIEPLEFYAGYIAATDTTEPVSRDANMRTTD